MRFEDCRERYGTILVDLGKHDEFVLVGFEHSERRCWHDGTDLVNNKYKSTIWEGKCYWILKKDITKCYFASLVKRIEAELEAL